MAKLRKVYAGMTVSTLGGTLITEWWCAETDELIAVQSSVPEGCEWVA